jgi:anti-anti-sigma factor
MMLATHAPPASYASPLTIDRREEDGCVTLSVHGEIDLTSASLLQRELDDAESSAPGRIVLDLAALDFIDSSGLRVLLEAHRRAESSDHVLVLARVPRDVRRLLSLTGSEAILLIE